MKPTRKGPRPLAELIEPCLGPVIAKQGFSGADILVSWPEIVGERLGALSQPVKLDWPRRRREDERTPAEPGTLVVRTDGAAALELQHLAPVVIERVNSYYGWRCIGRLVLKQAPVRRLPVRRPTAPALSPGRSDALARSIVGIDDAALGGALARLGTALLGRAPIERQNDGPVDEGHAAATITVT